MRTQYLQMQKHTFTTIILFLLGSMVFFSGCKGGRKLVKRADAAFELGEYHKALGMYERIQEKEKASNKQQEAYLFYKIAQCYDFLNNSKRAESRYSRAIRKGYKEPEVYVLCADQMLMNQNYEEASELYLQAKEKMPDNKRVGYGLESLELAKIWTDSVTRYEVENVRKINSRDNEFAPAYAKEDFSHIYFTSTKHKEEKLSKVSDITGTKFTDVFEARVNRKGKWEEPLALEDTTVNGPFDDGAMALTADVNTMYYTSCKKETGKKLGCQIFETSRRGIEWGAAKNIAITGDTISVGHPSISADGQTLYFSSRMQGGFGGADIWYVTRSSSSGTWSKPVNAGARINTPGDEMYPFIREDGNLYFSSDYWPGFGGMDIFRAIKNEAGFWDIANMLPPVNSPQDDFGIIFQGKKEKGLFTSARDEGRGGDDIFSFELPDLEFYATGKILDRNTEEGVDAATVTVYGSDGSVSETETDKDGTYSVKLAQYTDYIILGSAENYLRKKVKVSTNNLIDNKTFEENISLIPTGESVEIPNIFYDFGKWTLNEHSKAALIELAELLEDNPNITIELGSHTDMVGDSLSNMLLSKKRAQSVIDYLYEKGYDPDRLIAKGYGENVPVVINDKAAAGDTLFYAGLVLTPDFIESLPTQEAKDRANQKNRRTELKVLTMDYIPKPEYFARYRRKVKGQEQ